MENQKEVTVNTNAPEPPKAVPPKATSNKLHTDSSKETRGEVTVNISRKADKLQAVLDAREAAKAAKATDKPADKSSEAAPADSEQETVSQETEETSSSEPAEATEKPAAQVEETEKALDEDDLHKRTMALIKEEKRLTQEKEQFKAEAKLMTDFKEALEVGKSNLPKLVSTVLSMIGASEEDYLNCLVKGEDLTPKMSLDQQINAKFKAFEEQKQKEAQEFAKKQEEEKQAAINKQIEQFKSEAKSFVTTNAKIYPLLADEDGHDELIFEVWAGQLKKDGKNLTNKEVCDLIEKKLKEKITNKYKLFSGESEDVVADKDTSKKKNDTSKAPAKTLTNKMTGSSPNTKGTVKPQFKSEKERKAWFLSQLNKK